MRHSSSVDPRSDQRSDAGAEPATDMPQHPDSRAGRRSRRPDAVVLATLLAAAVVVVLILVL